MVPNEHNLNMIDTLHTKCLIKCLNDNYIDYLVSLDYGNDVKCNAPVYNLLFNYFRLSLESFIWLMWFMLIYDMLWCFNILLSDFILYFLVEYVGYLE